MIKKQYSYILLLIAIFGLTITTLSIARAEEPPLRVNSPQKDQGRPVPSAVREQLRTKIDIEDAAKIRAKILDGRTAATNTRDERKDNLLEQREKISEARREGRLETKNASGTMEQREARKNTQLLNVFKIRQQALVKQLNVSLNNLKQVRDRIASRIEKATSSGRDMTKAKSLLVIADTKITKAREAVATLAAYTPTLTATTTASSTASSTVDLVKPRQVGEVAIKAIKEAHQALVAVVKAIAQNMGLGNSATTTPPVMPPITTPTTTPTTTPAL